jgi:hypothetical protein
VRQSPVSKDVKKETEEATALKPLPGDNRRRYSRLRRLRTCCSELQRERERACVRLCVCARACVCACARVCVFFLDSYKIEERPVKVDHVV